MLGTMLLYKMLKHLFDFYRRSLYVVVPLTGTVGFSSGLVENFTREPTLSPLQVFTNVIGYTTLGVATGVAYPLTFPAMSYSRIIQSD
jgi:hypothetical protein